MLGLDVLRKGINFLNRWQCRARRRWLAASADPRPSSDPYISGDTFRTLADHILDDTSPSLNPKEVRSRQILFVQTSHLPFFFERVLPRLDVPYRLVTHNSDLPVDERYLDYIDDRLIVWFAQNCLLVHPKVVPTPIGLENVFYQSNGRVGVFDRLRNRNILLRKKDRILFGFSVNTNRSEREPAYRYFAHHPLCDEIRRFPNPWYLRRLATYKFVAAPPGNGVDTHRTWEAMYLGVVPIVKRSPPVTFFENQGLPLWVVEDWQELDVVDTNVLADRYSATRDRFGADPLFMGYWREKLSAFGR